MMKWPDGLVNVEMTSEVQQCLLFHLVCDALGTYQAMGEIVLGGGGIAGLVRLMNMHQTLPQRGADHKGTYEILWHYISFSTQQEQTINHLAVIISGFCLGADKYGLTYGVYPIRFDTMPPSLINEEQFNGFIRGRPICAVYFSGPNCAVCEVLKPKLFALLQQTFPKLSLGEVDCADSPRLAAQQMVFTIPTLIVYFDGKEGLRKARNFSLAELTDDLQRPYSILANE